MFKWAEGVTSETVADVSAGLDKLADLECVVSYHHGPDAALVEGNYDYAVVGRFDSVEGYQAYATDEGHVALVKKVIAPNISARMAVQFAE